MSKCERCGTDDPGFVGRGMVVTRDVLREFPAMMCLPCWRGWERYMGESDEVVDWLCAKDILDCPRDKRMPGQTLTAFKLMQSVRTRTALLLEAFISEKPEQHEAES